MRQTIAGLIAGAALAATVAASPALACAVTDPCSPNYQSYSSYSYGSGYGCGGYSTCGGVRERLPDPTGPIVHGGGPQYYYVNQGPTFTGPGDFAPVPTYQERAVTGWQSYSRPYYYGYNGGPYANTTSHYYDGAPDLQGPAVYSYRFARHHYYHRTHYRPYRVGPKYYYAARSGYRYGYAARPSVRYGYGVRHGYAPRFYAPVRSGMHGPRVHAPHYAAPRGYRPGGRPHSYRF